jgi:cytochrome P450 family 9
MFFWFAIIAVAYLFYKWATANNDYFEKREVAFIKPLFLIGSYSNLFVNKMSLSDVVRKWYNQVKDEK